jgi:hypothetical protein
LAQEHHPDKNSSPNAKDKFAEINKYQPYHLVHMRSSPIRPNAKYMIRRAQLNKILILALKIRIFSTSLSKQDMEGEAGEEDMLI